jgi:hypothetical protein
MKDKIHLILTALIFSALVWAFFHYTQEWGLFTIFLFALLISPIAKLILKRKHG